MLAAIIKKAAALKAAAREREREAATSREEREDGRECEEEDRAARTPKKPARDTTFRLLTSIMNKTDFILFSGAAAGAEAEFGACAERHGIEEVNFTFDGHKDVRSRGIRVLNHEELQAGDVSLEYVSRLMHRRYTDSPTIRKSPPDALVPGEQRPGDLRGRGDPRRWDRAGRNGLGRGVREAVQQAALRLRSGKGRLVRVDRARTGRAAAPTRRSSRTRTSPEPARDSSRRTAAARSKRSSRNRSTRLFRGASPLGLPHTLSRAPLRRRAPFAWLARHARSRLGTSVTFMR